MFIAALFIITKNKNISNIPLPGMNIETAAHLYDGILVSCKRNKLLINNKMDDSQMHLCRLKEARFKSYTLYDSIHLCQELQ